MIQLDGTDLVPVPGHRRALFGIGYMPEDRRLIGPLTVEDNIRLPAWASGLAHSAQRLGYIYEHMPEVAALARRRLRLKRRTAENGRPGAGRHEWYQAAVAG